MTDLILRGARVIDPLNHLDAICDVAISEGKIQEVAPAISYHAKEEIDFSGKVLQPGIIDSHVHTGSSFGTKYGQRMLAMKGVTTALDMAGPLGSILEESHEYGAGLNIAVLEAAYPPVTLKSATPNEEEINAFIDKALEKGAFGVKILGGHYPVDPEISANLIRCAYDKGAYIGWHAGSTKHGSNIEGMLEAVDAAHGLPLHLAHINSYCRGAIHAPADEANEAIAKLISNPNILCESYLSERNGASFACDENGNVLSKVTAACLTRFGFTADREGACKALRAREAFVNYDAGGYTDVLTSEEAVDYLLKHNCDVTGGFNVNPFISRVMIATAKRPDGSFVVDGISTDGGVFPRNVILSHGLSVVELGGMTLTEFVVKNSLNPARMLRLHNKGHLSVGADADITVYELQTHKAVAAYVAGKAIFENGQVVGKDTTFITTERGVNNIKAKGYAAVVVDPSEPYPERFIPR